MASNERMEAENRLASAQQALDAFEASLVTEVPDTEMHQELAVELTTAKLDELGRLQAERDAAYEYLERLKGRK